jgi:uncharacterized membrane protein YkoI
MRPRFASLALVLSLAALPLAIACERGENEENEAAEAAEGTAEAAEAAEMPQADLLKEATIDSMTARATALAEVPGGEITGMELEREDSLLIWSFDIKVAGKEGVEEIHVDAKTGKVVKTEHETDESEAAEAAKESGSD